MLRTYVRPDSATVNTNVTTDPGRLDANSTVFDFADDAVSADAVFPELAEFGVCQGVTDAARVGQIGDAALSNSTLHAIALHHLAERDGLRFAGPIGNQPLLGVNQIFHVTDLLSDRVDHAVGLAAASALRQIVQTA